MILSHSPKYQKDLKKFNQALEKITDPKKKIYYKKLIDELQFQVKIIDENHSSNNAGKIQPNILQENLKDLATIRYQLHNLVKDASKL